MAAAILTQTTVAPLLVAASIADAISTAMQTAGFTLIDTVNGATETRAFSFAASASTKGTVYIKLDVTTTTLNYFMADNYNVGTHAMVNFASGGAISLSLTIALNMIAVNHAEMRMVHIRNSSAVGAIGYVRPATKYSWWDESSFLYAFLPLITNARFQALPLSSIPLSTTGYALVNAIDVAPPSGGHQLIKSPFLVGASGTRCAWGQFSSDIAAVPGNGLAVLTDFQAGADHFNLILSNTGEASYLAVKI